MFSLVERTLNSKPALPKGLDIDELTFARRAMNRIMQGYVDQVRCEPEKFIKDRSWYERLLELPPVNDLLSSQPTMYKDKWTSFNKTLLCALDFDFLMLDVCTISFIDCAARDNTTVQSRILLGVLIAYILDQGLLWMRSRYGRRNLSKHTLADEKFLI
mmetsp:Transcript_4612/g.3110  ORF Transcript_4612/g.3110 Transcript_4612/m.3110 type:complete len:159 (-) Transcript_4612:24-500(-)